MGDFSINDPQITLYEDNQSTIRLSEDEGTNQRTKHISIKNFFVRDFIRSKNAKIEYLQSSEMGADGLTKILSGPKLKNFILFLNNRCGGMLSDNDEL